MTAGGGTNSRWLGPRAVRWVRASQRALAAVLTVYVLLTVPGIRPAHGYDATIDGWLQNGVLFAATALIVLRALLVRSDRLGWSLIAVGVGFYAIGNTLYFAWVQYEATIPYPSIADMFWISSYVALYGGLFLLVRRHLRGTEPLMWLDAVVVALGLAAISVEAIAVVLRDTHGSPAAVLTTMAYPVGDLLLMTLLLGSFALHGFRPDRMWMYLMVGFGMFAVADTIYALRVATNTFTEGTPLDALWAVAVVVIAAAALRAPRSSDRAPAAGWGRLIVPGLFTLSSLGLLYWATQRSHPALSVDLAAGAIVTGLVRGALTFREVQRLASSRREARTDDLTGLGNRRLFHQVLGSRIRALAPGEQIAVLLLDLDHFKEVNDSLGHPVGDRLLRQVGRRLAAHLRDQDLLVRLGGDEFAILLDTPRAAHALAVAERLRADLQRTFDVDGIPIETDTSIGIAMCPTVARTVEGLLQRADIAMYEAKAERLGQCMYEAEDDDDLSRRHQFVADIRAAIDNDELLLHFQPEMDLATRQVVAYEALVRWQHPQQGLLAPAAFLAEAERYGLMRRLTTKVLTLALDEVVRWRSLGCTAAVAVNISAGGLVDLQLVDQVQVMLELRGLPGSALVIEVTESMLVAEPQRAITALQRLRELGVRVSIDDYGTGYSSLARLRDLPVDELKLDRSFVEAMTTDPRAATIVESTVMLARSLELLIVAEGIEGADQERHLAALGVDLGQGFHIGRPVPGTELAARLRPATARIPAPRQAVGSAGPAARP